MLQVTIERVLVVQKRVPCTSFVPPHADNWLPHSAQVLGAIGGNDQVLVFVHSRKETYKTGKFLKETAMAAETLARFVKVRLCAASCALMLCVPSQHS